MAIFRRDGKGSIKMDQLHYNRFLIERKAFLPQLELYQSRTRAVNSQSPEYREAEDAIDGYFPDTFTQKEKWETILREENYRSTIQWWEKAGAAIFSVRDELLKMFLHTDVGEIPINSINMPYTSIYCYLGDANPFPDFHPEYTIDGFYLWGDDSDIAFWKHEPSPDIAKIRMESQESLKQFLDVIDNPHLYQQDYIANVKQLIKDCGGRENYVEDAIKSAMSEWEKHERRYQSFLEDPDSFNYGEDWQTYLTLYLDFTVIRKDGAVKVQSPRELIEEPFLHAKYDFDTHRFTVSQAIENLFKEGASPMEHHFESFDPYNEQVIDPADPNWLDKMYINRETGEKTPGNYWRLNNYLNVTNRPDLLQDITRLAFNTLCYLNWKDRDVVLKYPSAKLQAEEEEAKTNKSRKKVASKASIAGYRKLYFCGYSYPPLSETKSDNASSTANPVKTHWRRGHWRNQPFGKGLRDTKLIWIKPVIVALTSETPKEKTVYQL